MPILKIPAKSYVKQYFQHENILGPDLVVTKRHMVGEVLSMVLSFGPIALEMLPVEYRPGGTRTDELLSMELDVRFDIDPLLVSPHHLFAVGKSMHSMFEFGLFNYALGYFTRHQALPWKAAVGEFFEKYGIDASNGEDDYVRRYMGLRYNGIIKDQYLLEVADHRRRMGG